MPQDNYKLIENLVKLLIEQDGAINELLEIEEDLQFAMLRQADLIRLQFELLANPYYNDIA
jgi:hypothetical protein